MLSDRSAVQLADHHCCRRVREKEKSHSKCPIFVVLLSPSQSYGGSLSSPPPPLSGCNCWFQSCHALSLIPLIQSPSRLRLNRSKSLHPSIRRQPPLCSLLLSPFLSPHLSPPSPFSSPPIDNRTQQQVSNQVDNTFRERTDPHNVVSFTNKGVQ